MRREVYYELAMFFTAMISIVLLYKYVAILSIVLILLYFVGNRLWHANHDYIFYIIGGILGPVAEIIATHFGAWSYAYPTFLNIPLWLPFAWGLVTLAIVRIAENWIVLEKRN